MNGNTHTPSTHVKESLSTNTSTDSLKLSPSFQELRHAIPLIPVVKDYAWGIRGMDSRVGRYAMQSGVPLMKLIPMFRMRNCGLERIPVDPPRCKMDELCKRPWAANCPFYLKYLSCGQGIIDSSASRQESLAATVAFQGSDAL